jgi:uncharacterized protein (UPF0332 family)
MESGTNFFAFLAAALGPEQADLVSYFDRMRNKRNQAVYGVAGRIAETEARNLLAKATAFVRLVKRLVKDTA